MKKISKDKEIRGCKTEEGSAESKVTDDTSTLKLEKIVPAKKINQINLTNSQQNQNPNFKNKKNNFNHSDFEFDGILVKAY
jgi:transcription termination factor Rho